MMPLCFKKKWGEKKKKKRKKIITSPATLTAFNTLIRLSQPLKVQIKKKQLIQKLLQP
jgi:hypothetical protein